MHDSAMSSYALTDKRILVTRSEQHCPALSRMVESRGAIAVSLPCLSIEYMPQSVAAGLAVLEDCSDVLFTSVNGVHAVGQMLSGQGKKLAVLLQNKRLAVVGGKTAFALEKLGVGVDIVPEMASQDGLIKAYEKHGLPNGLLFFRAEEGRDVLSDALTEQGVTVVIAPVYRTVCPAQDAGEIIAMLQRDEIDAVLLGSAKTAAHYLQRMGSPVLANRPVLVAISEKMATAVQKLGLNVQVVAKDASFEAMLDALAEYFDSGS